MHAAGGEAHAVTVSSDLGHCATQGLRRNKKTIRLATQPAACPTQAAGDGFEVFEMVAAFVFPTRAILLISMLPIPAIRRPGRAQSYDFFRNQGVGSWVPSLSADAWNATRTSFLAMDQCVHAVSA